MSHLVSFPGLGLSFMVNRVAFTLGSVNVYWYGILIALGLFLGVMFAFRHCAEFGIDPDRMIDVIAVGTVMAIVCARAYYVAMSPYQYENIWQMLDIRSGGIAIYGAIAGAFVFGGLACKWRKVPVLPMCDLTAMGFLIGQGCGRWGNFFNQEAFGCNTTLPWGMYSEATRAYLSSAVVTLPAGVTADPTLPVHPTFLYESLWCLAGFVMLYFYFKKRRFHGDVALRYAAWYGLGRFWIEGLRTDSLLLVPELNLRASQLVAAVTVLAAAALLVVFTRRSKAAQPLLVPLALNGETLKALQAAQTFQKDGRVGICCADRVSKRPVGASRAEVLAATEAYNKTMLQAVAQYANAPQNKGE